MDRFADAAAISAAILAAPAWARIALNQRDPRLRERGAQEVAETLLAYQQGDLVVDTHPDQLALSL